MGGLNWNTNEETLQKYFSKYGDVVDSVIMRDNLSQKSRGFGFITFADGKIVDGVLSLQHTIDGKIVDPKRAVPKSDTEKTEKIFVGGLLLRLFQACKLKCLKRSFGNTFLSLGVLSTLSL